MGKGNALLLSMLDLADRLPPELQAGSKRAAHVARVTFSFAYFKNTEAAERRLESSPELAALDGACQQVCSCSRRYASLPTTCFSVFLAACALPYPCHEPHFLSDELTTALRIFLYVLTALQALGGFPGELYALLGAIVELHVDFLHLLSQLQEGTFVQCSLHSLLLVSTRLAHLC